MDLARALPKIDAERQRRLQRLVARAERSGNHATQRLKPLLKPLHKLPNGLGRYTRIGTEQLHDIAADGVLLFKPPDRFLCREFQAVGRGRKPNVLDSADLTTVRRYAFLVLAGLLVLDDPRLDLCARFDECAKSVQRFGRDLEVHLADVTSTYQRKAVARREKGPQWPVAFAKTLLAHLHQDEACGITLRRKIGTHVSDLPANAALVPLEARIVAGKEVLVRPARARGRRLNETPGVEKDLDGAREPSSAIVVSSHWQMDCRETACGSAARSCSATSPRSGRHRAASDPRR